MEKQQKLVDILLKRTRAGSMDWKDTPKEGVYQVSFANSSVQIKQGGDFSDELFIISLLNRDGEVVDTFNDEDIDPSRGGPYYKAMREICTTARRTALGAEKVLDEILGELEPSRRA